MTGDIIKIEIKGAKEMERLLRELGSRAAAKIGVQALRAGAKPIIGAAKQALQDVSKTGNLANSIDVKILKPKKNGEFINAAIGPIWKKIPDPTRAGGFDNPGRRAHLTEFGTSHSAAHPFMRPAVDTQHQQAIDEMGRVLGKGIEREALKLAKPGKK